MLFTFGFALAALVVLALYLRASHGEKASDLGWVSQRWLTEHRGGQSSPAL
jgi:hypothetical protein